MKILENTQEIREALEIITESGRLLYNAHPTLSEKQAFILNLGRAMADVLYDISQPDREQIAKSMREEIGELMKKNEEVI